MKNTKKNILDTSRMLFNKFGYSQVTIRMIAQKLNISSGNLNYHYKKREDILKALYFEMVAVFDKRVQQLDTTIITLKKIKEDATSSMIRMVDYRFFWTDLYYLLSINDNIRTHFEQVRQDRENGYHFVFKTLENNQLLQPESYPNERQFLIKRMIDFSNTWLYASHLYRENSTDSKYVETQATILLSILFPYLTKTGKQEFLELMEEPFGRFY